MTFLNIRVNAPDDALSCEVCLSRFPSSLPPSLVVGILTTVTVAAPFLLPSPRKGTMSTPATGKRKGPVVPDEVSSKKVSPVLRVVIKAKTHCYTKHWVSLFYSFFCAVIITLSLDNGLAGLLTIPSAQLWLSTNELQTVCSLCTVVVACIGHRKFLGVKLLGSYTRLLLQRRKVSLAIARNGVSLPVVPFLRKPCSSSPCAYHTACAWFTSAQ